MIRTSNGFRQKLRLSIWLILISVVNLIVYNVQLAYTNAYMGFLPVSVGPIYCTILVISLLILAQLIPDKIQKPSDFFNFFYGFFIVGSYATFYSVSGAIDAASYCLHMALLTLPLIIAKLFACIKLKISIPNFVKESQLELFIFLICCVGLFVALINSPSSASFSLDDVYDRRIEGRSVFAAGSPAAYLNANVCNGMVPFLSFLAGFKNKKWLLLFSVAVGLAYFYVLGIKAHMLFLVLGYVVGIGVRQADPGLVPRFTFRVILILFMVFVIEYWLLNVSVTAELFFRRAFSVPAHVILQYMELMSGFEGNFWSATSGISHAPDGVTHLVGILFYGTDLANVNTNAFIYSLASRGLMGYLGAIFLVSIFFAFLDTAYRSYGNHAFLFIGFIYALLVTEQSALTAMSTSGVALIFLLSVLTIRGWRLPSATVSATTKQN